MRIGCTTACGEYWVDQETKRAKLVKVPDKGELKDRSYVRRQAILVQDPSELSVLEKQELRQR